MQLRRRPTAVAERGRSRHAIHLPGRVRGLGVRRPDVHDDTHRRRRRRLNFPLRRITRREGWDGETRRIRTKASRPSEREPRPPRTRARPLRTRASRPPVFLLNASRARERLGLVGPVRGRLFDLPRKKAARTFFGLRGEGLRGETPRRREISSRGALRCLQVVHARPRLGERPGAARAPPPAQS